MCDNKQEEWCPTALHLYTPFVHIHVHSCSSGHCRNEKHPEHLINERATTNTNEQIVGITSWQWSFVAPPNNTALNLINVNKQIQEMGVAYLHCHDNRMTYLPYASLLRSFAKT